MSNRPMKNKKKVVVEDEHEHEVEYRPPGQTSRDLIIQIGVTILILSFVLAPMLVFVFTPTPAAPPPQEQQQQQADDTEQQIKHYSGELAKNPNDPATLANLAYYTTRKAMRLPPTPESNNQRMTLLKEAEGNFRKALDKDPKYGFAQAELAKNLMSQQNYKEANAFIEKAMKDADESMASSDEKMVAEGRARKVELLLVSSGILSETEGLPAAIKKLDEAVALEPGNPQIYKQRGFMQMSNGDKEAAKKDWTTMVDIGQKSGNQNAAMEGQMFLQMLEQPAPTATPGVVATPSSSSPVTTPSPISAVTATPSAPATP